MTLVTAIVVVDVKAMRLNTMPSNRTSVSAPKYFGIGILRNLDHSSISTGLPCSFSQEGMRVALGRK